MLGIVLCAYGHPYAGSAAIVIAIMSVEIASQKKSKSPR
jgi:hypothetical protein